jgi:hypothetical protein
VIFLLAVGMFLGVLDCTPVQAATASFVTLKDGKTYTKYDVTGDGKKDTVSFKSEMKNVFTFRAYVNKKCALTVELDDYPYYYTTIKLITLKNGKKYLYLHLAGDDDDGPYDLYTYKNGKFKKEVNLIKNVPNGYMPTPEISKVSGNKIYFKTTYCTDVVGGMRYNFTYQYKSGKLKLTSNTFKVTGYGISSKGGIAKKAGTFSLAKSVKLYSKKTLKGKTFTLSKGTKVKVTKIYITSKTVSYYVKASNGKSGWLKDYKGNGLSYIHPAPCTYA